jgi:hypothetical protein
MMMVRILIGVLLTGLATAALAQQYRAEDKDACGRDATRLCAKVLGDGDGAVLACLKEQRTRLRPVCRKYLGDMGQ